MSYQKPNILSVTGRTLRIEHQSSPGQPSSYLTAAVSASGTSLTVVDNSAFENTNLLRIGRLGEKGTEIVSVNGAVTRGTAMTCTAVSLGHPVGTEVGKVLFDQWNVYGNATNTAVGATLIATVYQTPDAPFTTYVNSGTEFAYYFALPYDSVNAVTGDSYSDGIAATGAAELSVGNVIRKALWATDARMDDRITEEWLFSEINDCLRYVGGKLKRWAALQANDSVVGQATLGSWSWSLPSDIEEPDFERSVLSVRVGTGDRLTWQDKREWVGLLEGVAHTQVRTQAVATDVTLEIDNSYDFPDSGSVDVYVSGTKHTLTYTGVTRSATAGVLTGVPATGTGSITVTVPVDADVWYGQSEGDPKWYTIFDDRLHVWPMVGSTSENTNVLMDYYSTRTAVDSYGDLMEQRRYDAVKHWLAWKVRAKLSGVGKLDMQDGDWLMFRDVLNDMVSAELGSQKWKMYPKITQYTGRT